MKAILTRKWAIPMLTLLLAFVGSGGAKAQITEVNANRDKATIKLYLRFTDGGSISDVDLRYSIGQKAIYTNANTQAATLSKQTVLDKMYYVTTIADVPYDNVNHCLAQPIYIPRNFLSWKEGLLSARQYSDNDMAFYGDTFLYVEKRHWRGGRYDYVTIDEFMEEALMYVYNPLTGDCETLWPNASGQCTYVLNTQDFKHVGDRTYNMSNYPSHTELVLARKSAFQSYSYNIPAENQVVGVAVQIFETDANLRRDDVFHACADGGNLGDVTFKTLREMAQTQPWPTGCTANRSFVVDSHITDPTHDDYPGFVGHLKFTLTPRTMMWKAEAWVEQNLTTNSDGWATFSTPYDVAVPDLLSVLAVTNIAKEKTATEDARIDIKSMNSVPIIPAGTGVVIRGVGKFQFHPATPTPEDRAEYVEAYAASGNKMVYVPLNQINSLPYTTGNYVLTYNTTEKAPYFVPATPSSETGEWSETASAGCIPPFKSYLHLDNPSEVGARLIINFDGEITGISSASLQTTNDADGVIYDLSGRRYNSAYGLQPGLYIVNGKKCYINR